MRVAAVMAASRAADAFANAKLASSEVEMPNCDETVEFLDFARSLSGAGGRFPVSGRTELAQALLRD